MNAKRGSPPQTQRTQRERRGLSLFNASAPSLRTLRLCGESLSLNSDFKSQIKNPKSKIPHGVRIGFPTEGTMKRHATLSRAVLVLTAAALLLPPSAAAQRTAKPVLHGRHWVAVTGKPLGATAGAMIFAKGGNAVDAACAMLASVATMWDVLSWGGETQALIYHPGLKKVIGMNDLGVARARATRPPYQGEGQILTAE